MLLDEPVVESDMVQLLNTPEHILSTMVHELLHVLGFYGHNNANRFPDSNMRGDELLYADHLPGIDGDGLLAVYGRFEPGTQPEGLSAENLGSWTDTSFHLRRRRRVRQRQRRLRRRLQKRSRAAMGIRAKAMDEPGRQPHPFRNGRVVRSSPWASRRP